MSAKQSFRNFIRTGNLVIGALTIYENGQIDVGSLEITTDGGLTGGNMNLNGLVEVNGSLTVNNGDSTVIDSNGNIICNNLVATGVVRMPGLPSLTVDGAVQIAAADGALSGPL